MWIFTTDGFYSVVQDGFCKPDEVVVRARIRQDLENILDNFEPEVEIIEIQAADYRYRMIVPKQLWARYLMNSVKKINYSNFKNQLDHGDDKRHQAYFRCWAAMNQFQKGK